MKHHQGFTLIELLIVIAIIAILMAVLIPNLVSARERAQDVGAVACASEILKQGTVFLVDNNTYANFDATGTYEARSCEGDSVISFDIQTATANVLAGTVSSKSGATIQFSNETGVLRQ